jgi:biotin carboxyl carrier protein
MNWDGIDQAGQCDQSTYAGLILEISVVVGQTVKENDIYWWKPEMENDFLSPRDGIINRYR